MMVINSGRRWSGQAGRLDWSQIMKDPECCLGKSALVLGQEGAPEELAGQVVSCCFRIVIRGL